jgi:hypothetical protein
MGEVGFTKDLRSVDRKVVRVRLPPSAPLLISLFIDFHRLPTFSRRARNAF